MTLRHTQPRAGVSTIRWLALASLLFSILGHDVEAADSLEVLPVGLATCECRIDLLLPEEVEAGNRGIPGEIRVTTTGTVPCTIPADLWPFGGHVTLTWSSEDSSGTIGPFGRCGGGRIRETVTLPPGTYYGHRINIPFDDMVNSIRIDSSWPAGRYTFTAAMQWSPTPSARVDTVSSPPVIVRVGKE
jgi:hypothetical protein